MKLFNQLALIGLAIVMMACGGAGTGVGTTGSTGTTSGDGSKFAGEWSGTFENVIQQNGHGPIALTIDDDGTFTGQGTNQTLHADFTASGIIADNGALSGTMVSGSTSATIGGSLGIENGHLAGVVNLTSGSSFQQITVDLTK